MTRNPSTQPKHCQGFPFRKDDEKLLSNQDELYDGNNHLVAIYYPDMMRAWAKKCDRECYDNDTTCKKCLSAEKMLPHLRMQHADMAKLWRDLTQQMAAGRFMFPQ